jgi:hypothetical protein
VRWLAPLLAVGGWVTWAGAIWPAGWPLVLAWLVAVVAVGLLAQAPPDPRRVGAAILLLLCIFLTTLGGLFFVPAAVALMLPGGRAARPSRPPVPSPSERSSGRAA